MNAQFDDGIARCFVGDALTVLQGMPAESVQCVVTSPPYWGLRDYAVDGQLGLEPTPEEYVAKMVAVFGEVRRVLRKDGTLWLNLGDCYVSSVNGTKHDPKFPARQAARVSESSTLRGNGHVGGWPKLHDDRAFRDKPFSMVMAGLKPKDLVGMPWMLAFALRADGWYLRCDVIWSKPNPMPESVTDRPTKAHEYLFLLSRSERYCYDAAAIREQRTTTRPELLAFGERVAVGYPGHQDRRRDKQGSTAERAPHGGDRFTGFNERWDNAEANGHDGAGRNRRSVWTIPTQPYPEAHFATFPEALVGPCILAGTKPQDTVLDPFAGSGTTLAVAKSLDRRAIGIELNPAYLPLIADRCQGVAPQIALL